MSKYRLGRIEAIQTELKALKKPLTLEAKSFKPVKLVKETKEHNDLQLAKVVSDGTHGTGPNRRELAEEGGRAGGAVAAPGPGRRPAGRKVCLRPRRSRLPSWSPRGGLAIFMGVAT